MRKPLTMFVVEANTAMAPSHVLNPDSCSPASRMAPTTAIAEIALVSDISGVCSSRETRRMTSRPMNVASISTNRPSTKSNCIGRKCYLSPRSSRFSTATSACSGRDSSFRSPARTCRRRRCCGTSRCSCRRRSAPIALGMVGLVRLMPIIFFSIAGGTLADASDRRRVMFFTQTAMALTALALAVLTLSRVEPSLAASTRSPPSAPPPARSTVPRASR